MVAAHKGVKGNKKADKLTQQALKSENVQIEIIEHIINRNRSEEIIIALHL